MTMGRLGIAGHLSFKISVCQVVEGYCGRDDQRQLKLPRALPHLKSSFNRVVASREM